MLALLGLGGLAGCAKEPVSIDQVTVTADDLARCEALVAALPEELDGQDRRAVAPSAALGAAWGDPAIVLTCGVSVTIPRQATCAETDGVGWYVPAAASDDQTVDIDMVTIGLRPAVSVHVPADYRPPPTIMVQLAPALKQTLAPIEGCG